MEKTVKNVSTLCYYNNIKLNMDDECYEGSISHADLFMHKETYVFVCQITLSKYFECSAKILSALLILSRSVSLSRGM